MPDIDLERMVSDLRYVKDRWDILDCINRQSRGHDRHDVDLMAAAYHDNGVDEHGPTVKTAAEYGDWANAVHGAAFEQHAHNITTHTCDIDGDTAHCESYVIVAGRRGNLTTLMGGRYLDRLERREGRWKIAVRRCTVEWTLQGDGSALTSGNFSRFIKGTRDRHDPSYARPLTLDDTPAQRW
jgi:hypothetical protein